MLADVLPAVHQGMKILHPLLQGQMVFAVKAGIVWGVGVMQLYGKHRPGNTLCGKPGFKLGRCD